MEFDPGDHPHRRFNPLTGEHVLVSPHRMKRPWNGQAEDTKQPALPSYEPSCLLCPGNERMGGLRNPTYKETFSFSNDYPAVLPGPIPMLPLNAQVPIRSAASAPSIDALFASEPVRGRCQVVCFHPRHDLTLARMAVDEITSVVRMWRGIYEAEGKFLQQDGCGGYVQIFENRGSMMGASAPHPHGQVWSVSYVPDEVATEMANLEAYADTHRSGPINATSQSEGDAPCRQDGTPCLLCSYAYEEVQRGERVVALDEAGGWVALVPFWAKWPFETLVLPYRRHIRSLSDMTPKEDRGLARVLKTLLVRYDNLFHTTFPYSMGLHQAPFYSSQSGGRDRGKEIGDGAKGDEGDAAHIHVHFYPPLLRSAGVRKFLVGFEMLCEAQRDLTPEQAAMRLQAVSDEHYLETGEVRGA